jgi:hypothetical protein
MSTVPVSTQRGALLPRETEPYIKVLLRVWNVDTALPSTKELMWFVVQADFLWQAYGSVEHVAVLARSLRDAWTLAPSTQPWSYIRVRAEEDTHRPALHMLVQFLRAWCEADTDASPQTQAQLLQAASLCAQQGVWSSAAAACFKWYVQQHEFARRRRRPEPLPGQGHPIRVARAFRIQRARPR